MPIITELFAFVAEEEEGNEGVIGMSLNMPGVGPSFTPLIGADMERVEQLRPYAIDIAKTSGKKVVLKKFTMTEEVEPIWPLTSESN